MRIIHTADWHLGCALYQQRLLPDQRQIMDQIIAIVRDTRPDAVLIAGDLYDHGSPSGEAMALLDDTLYALVETGATVIAVAGNHDRPQLLGFGARLLATGRLHLVTSVQASPARVTLRDAWGPVHCYALPYAEPLAIHHALGEDPSIVDHHTATAAWAARVWDGHPRGERAIAIAHGFVSGGEGSEERQLMVGGAAAVGASCLAGFTYVALGHLHRAQQIGDLPIHYAGSPLKYSFAEVEHHKSVTLVELGGDGAARAERILLRAPREMRRLAGTLADLLRAAEGDPGHQDYLSVRLLDEGPVVDPVGRLRQFYPHILELIPARLEGERLICRGGVDHRERPMEELFNAFIEHRTGVGLSPEETDVVVEIIGALRRAEREG